MIPAKKFYMIRHGETEANVKRVMAGSLDSPLTENGRNQAKAIQKIVANLEVKPSAIFHSHLSRARDTAHIINEALNLPIHENELLAEFHAGDWEGVPYEKCQSLLTGWDDPPNGETSDEFCARIRKAKHEILDAHDDPVMIVSHGGVFRGLGKIYGLNVPGKFPNCHLHEFDPHHQHERFPWKVYRYNHAPEEFKTETDIYHASEDWIEENILRA
mgnify:CR=1 FL=1